jgi:hypothetical protein
MQNIIRFNQDLENNLNKIQNLPLTKTFRTPSYYEKLVYEPKKE